MDQAQRLEWNQRIIEEFRANKGVVGGQFEGSLLLLLTTTGARSGESRTMPLACLADGDRYVVFAANGGRPTRPGWYYNLLADPTATVEVGSESFHAVATFAEGEERDRLWAERLLTAPFMADFQAAAPGPIPVVVLTAEGGAVSSEA
ncbi:nitroreductase/quinone reductase family protein [Streptacidiphilus sp. EB129]|uniref:nitroreductase/quinone reductase family protein n=1 Tax=Streptacidiphilus sp. EB129 TaxID=3156262 RepID=UPI003519D521